MLFQACYLPVLTTLSQDALANVFLIVGGEFRADAKFDYVSDTVWEVGWGNLISTVAYLLLVPFP